MSEFMQDIIDSAREKLIASPFFSPLIGTDVGQDDVSGVWSDAWVFKGSDDYNTPERDPENSGTSTVVLSMRNTSWTSPNINNTADFPRLEFTILSDQSRATDTRLTLAKDAEFRCDRVAKAIIKEFNDVGNVNHHWPNGVYIISCLLWTRLRIQDVDKKDGLVSGDLSFALIV